MLHSFIDLRVDAPPTRSRSRTYSLIRTSHRRTLVVPRPMSASWGDSPEIDDCLERLIGLLVQQAEEIAHVLHRDHVGYQWMQRQPVLGHQPHDSVDQALCGPAVSQLRRNP